MRAKTLASSAYWVVLLAWWMAPGISQAAAPDWLRAIGGTALPEYPPETAAVVLLDEVETRVTGKGEVRSRYRQAYKVLTSEGLDLAWVRLQFDSETRISDLKAWNLKAGGIVHEVGSKEAVETQLVSGILFQDDKQLILFIPQVEVGSVLGVEYERRHRPYILQDFRGIQQRIPVMLSRYSLDLPEDWEYEYHVRNHADLSPQQTGRNRWVWEWRDLLAIPDEEGMPALPQVAASLLLAYFPQEPVRSAESFDSWDRVAGWFHRLIEPRSQPSAAVEQFARQSPNIGTLASFVQRQIRYVAVEIGIGGYQPHFAEEVFRNKYGDCKDKVTLLMSLLETRGLESYPVLVHNAGGSLEPEFPSPYYFNHLIAAIRLAEGAPEGPAVLDHPELGRLLLFDPTDHLTPYGELPPDLQGTRALLVQGDRGHVIETPVAQPFNNRILRVQKLTLNQQGQLEGQVTEMYWGRPAIRERAVFQGSVQERWLQATQATLVQRFPGAAVTHLTIGNLEEKYPLQEVYQFRAPYYGQIAGDLMILPPCLIVSEAYPFPPRQERVYPLKFGYRRLHSESCEISLPPGYAVESLPEPVEQDLPFAHYRSEVIFEDNLIRYSRSLEIRQLLLKPEEVPALRELYRVIEQDEHRPILLRLQNGAPSE